MGDVGSGNYGGFNHFYSDGLGVEEGLLMSETLGNCYALQHSAVVGLPAKNVTLFPRLRICFHSFLFSGIQRSCILIDSAFNR